MHFKLLQMKLKETFQAYQAAAKKGEPVYDLVINQESKNPMEVTRQCLMKLLDDNKDTEYGRKYDFASIKSIEEYQKRLPVITYDNIAQDLERMMRGEKNILTAYSFSHMNETSGTIGAMKVIPMTDEQMQMFVKYNRYYTDGLMSRRMGEGWMHGRAFCTSEGNHRTLESGITVGCASSKMVDFIGGREAADQIMRIMYTSPVDASAPKPGVDAKYLHARFFLEDGDITGMVCGFFSLATLYLKYIADNYQMLIHDIETGSIDTSVNMIPEVKDRILNSISPNPYRAQQLREIFKNGSDFPFIPLVWPSLTYICGVGADGFSNFDQAITERYGGGNLTRIYSGITSSEGLFSVPLDINNPDNLLAAGTGLIEFLPVEAGDDFSKIVLMDQLEVGKIYEIIYTNLSGFYRYRMSDAVQCTGYYNKTPLVQFMYRVNRTVNLVCEKTTEKALTATVEKSMQELGIKLRDYTMYPNGDVFPVRYEFLLETQDGSIPDIPLETISRTINANLCHFNAEYEDCFNVDHTLDWPVIHWLEPQTNDHFIDYMAAKGKSPSQQKPVRIITNELQRMFFYKFRVNWSGMTKDLALKEIDNQKDNLTGICDAIWDNPENRFHEFFAMDTICRYLEQNGFTIEKGIAGLPTAFKATYGSAKPNIGILAEFDALDSLSQKSGVYEKCPVKEGGLGHGCGHNILAAGAVGAAIGIKKYLESYPERGMVTLYGCPDEEVSGSKVFMAREGVFDNADVVFTWHPGDMNIVPYGTTAALQDIIYTFNGESVHSVAAFKLFHNALDACELMNTGTQYLKSQISDFGSINYSYADAGGDTPNVVPAMTKMHYCIRSNKQKDLNWLIDRVDNIAKGAALMTDTTVSSRTTSACSGYITNEIACRVLYNNFAEYGTVQFSEQDIDQANRICQTTSTSFKTLKACISMIEDKKTRRDLLMTLGTSPMFSGLIPPTSVEIANPASTDVGDVSRICPTAQIGVSVWPTGISSHSWQAVSLGKSNMAHNGLLKAAQIIAATAIDFCENPAMVENAWASHRDRTNGHEYKSPIPADLMPKIE